MTEGAMDDGATAEDTMTDDAGEDAATVVA
jgi:hypothetical protein